MMLAGRQAGRLSARCSRGLSTIDNSIKADGTQALQQLRLMTAIKTPYNPDGKIDLDAYDSHLEDQLANGVEGFIVGGTTGEGHLFHWDEHIMLIAHTKHIVGDRALVVGNTGSNSTGELRHATQQGFTVGMDAALSINPYYGKTSDAGVIAHLTSALDFGPTIIYNVPGRTGQDISVETMLQIADHPNFAGVKECMGRERIQAYSDRNIITWSGNDDECHETRHEAGCNGVISVTANLIPGLFSQMMKEPSYDVASDVAGLVDWLFVEPNPIGVNTLMMQLGLCQPVFRLPYVQYDAEMRAKGKALIEAIGLENVPGNKGCELMADGDFLHCADF